MSGGHSLFRIFRQMSEALLAQGALRRRQNCGRRGIRQALLMVAAPAVRDDFFGQNRGPYFGSQFVLGFGNRQTYD